MDRVAGVVGADAVQDLIVMTEKND